MRIPKKTTALVLAGAVALSSAAYGLGTQIDGGSASAARDGASAQRGSPPGVSTLAKELGVSAAELREALRDFHDQEHGERRDAFATALAKALGKSAQDVQTALDSVADRHRTRFANRLADALGVDAAKVTSALDELKDEGRGEPGDLAARLADKLGLEANAVEQALRELRPDKRGMRPHGHHQMPLRQLASALDVTRAELRKALREVRPGAAGGRDDKRQELVQFLAERFGLSEDKVENALPEFAAGPGPGGPGGPRGHGGPGPF